MDETIILAAETGCDLTPAQAREAGGVITTHGGPGAFGLAGFSAL